MLTDDELASAKNCKEAVDMIVEAIRLACKDVGNEHRDFITESDVVRQVLIGVAVGTVDSANEDVAWCVVWRRRNG